MKKQYNIWFLFLAGFCCSCNHHDLTENVIDLSAAQPVNVDSVAVESCLNPFAMKIVGDYLVIANNTRDTIVDVFSVPTLEYVKSGLTTGAGPDELFYPVLTGLNRYSANEFYIPLGYPEPTVAVITVPELDYIGKESMVLPAGWNQYCQVACKLNDSLSLGQRGELPLDWSIFDRNGEIKHMMTPEIPASVDGIAGNDAFQKMLARSASVAVSFEKERFAICHRCFPGIEIYGFDGIKIASLSALVDLDKIEVWVPSNDSCAESFYVMISNPADRSHSVLARIDWTGQIVKMYDIPYMTGAFGVDEVNNQVYFVCQPETDYIYKFSL